MHQEKARTILLEKYGEIYREALKYIHDTWGFQENEILSTRRQKRLVDARAYMARALYGADDEISYPDVGIIMNRHHTSIMNLCGRIAESRAKSAYNQKLKKAGVQP